jgi:hypothetical protein
MLGSGQNLLEREGWAVRCFDLGRKGQDNTEQVFFWNVVAHGNCMYIYLIRFEYVLPSTSLYVLTHPNMCFTCARLLNNISE